MFVTNQSQITGGRKDLNIVRAVIYERGERREEMREKRRGKGTGGEDREEERREKSEGEARYDVEQMFINNHSQSP